MKKIIILAAGMFLAGIASTHAQVRGLKDVFIGPVAGAGVNEVSNLNGLDRVLPAEYAGFSLLAFQTEYRAVGTGLIVSAEGSRLKTNGNIVTTRTGYMRLPVHCYYFFGDRYSRIRPDLHAGPVFGWGIGESSHVVMHNNEVAAPRPSTFNVFDVGVSAAAGALIKISDRWSSSIDIGYYRGVEDVVKNDIYYSVNNNASVSVSLLGRVSK